MTSLAPLSTVPGAAGILTTYFVSWKRSMMNFRAMKTDYCVKGQNGNETLMSHCNSGIDYVTLSFVNNSPENEPSGYPGDNFGAHCWAVYYNNPAGVQSQLLETCHDIQGSIEYCQQQGVKVLLGIGGVYGPGSNYSVSAGNGAEFATFLNNAFGSYVPGLDVPRPFDDGDHHVRVDGYLLDLETNMSMSACFLT
jgi:chitinase